MSPVEDDVDSNQASEVSAFSTSNSYNMQTHSYSYDDMLDNQLNESNLPNDGLSEEKATGEVTSSTEVSKLSNNFIENFEVQESPVEQTLNSVEEVSSVKASETEQSTTTMLTSESLLVSQSETNNSEDSTQVSSTTNAPKTPEQTPSYIPSAECDSSNSLSPAIDQSNSQYVAPLVNNFMLTTESLNHNTSPFDHSSESDNSHTTSSSSSSSDSDESESDMFGPPRNHSVTSPPPRCKTRVPMISARLRLKEERRRVIKLCGEKLERIRDPDSDLRRSVCINNTYYRLQAEVRKEKQGKQEQQLRQFQELNQPRSVTPLPSIDSMLNSNHHENDLEKIDRELSAISDSFDSNLEREKISIRPSEEVLRSYGYNNGLDIKYNDGMEGIGYNMTNSTSSTMINNELNMNYDKLNHTTIGVSYDSPYNETNKTMDSYELNYGNVKEVRFDLMKDDSLLVKNSIENSVNYNTDYDSVKEARFDTTNEINAFASAKQVIYNNVESNEIFDMPSEKVIDMYQKFNNDYALQDSKINSPANIYQNSMNYETDKQTFANSLKDNSRSYLSEVSNQSSTNFEKKYDDNPDKNIIYKDLYNSENQQIKSSLEETEIDVCGTSYDLDQKNDGQSFYKEDDDKKALDQALKNASDIVQETKAAQINNLEIFENKEDGSRKRSHEEVDDKLVQEVLSHLYAQQPATKPVTAIEDIEPEIKKFKADETAIEIENTDTQVKSDFTNDVDLKTVDGLKRKLLLENHISQEKRQKVDNDFQNDVTNSLDDFRKSDQQSSSNIDTDKTQQECDKSETSKINDAQLNTSHISLEKEMSTLQDFQQNENNGNHKSDFEIILDALRLSNPGNSCGANQTTSNDQNAAQDSQEQNTSSNNNNKRNNKCLDSCGQAAIMADIGGSNFHGLITSLET